ncbi:MAG TPA: phytanoyl-CoA dioxygenase family protein [Acidimicrobiales bacterium]|nr:phytanoyl-CoA dioxygenase family protein [Acidimicrobiales bacterium]
MTEPAPGPPATGLVTESDVEFYEQHGYWISPSIIAADVLDAAERGMERFYARDVDHLLAWDRRTDIDSIPPERYSHWGWRPAHGDVMRKNDYTSLRVDELGGLAHFPPVAACAARLSGSGQLRLWHDQLLYKPVDTGNNFANVKWHTDRFYWKTCSSEEMLTAWIPFADVAERDGPMCVLDGSHRWSDEVDIDWSSAPFSVIDDVVGQYHAELVPICLKRGQASFHHCKTIHGSGPNRGQAPRRSFVVHFQPSTNHYVERGYHHANDDLVGMSADGTPDYADPEISPQLYP